MQSVHLINYVKNLAENNENNDDSSLNMHKKFLSAEKAFSVKKRKPKRACINVGGVKFIILWKILERLPNSRLGKLRNAINLQGILMLCDDYKEDDEYFFDRNPDSFACILNFFLTDKLHLMENCCVLWFQDELDYWGIHENCLDLCCHEEYQQKKHDALKEVHEANYIEKNKNLFVIDRDQPLKLRIWNLMEDSHSSTAARVSVFFKIPYK